MIPIKARVLRTSTSTDEKEDGGDREGGGETTSCAIGSVRPVVDS